MKTIEINAEIRKETGKTATRKLRKEEKAPCVIYGGEKVVHVAATAKELKKIVFTPDVYLIDLKTDEKTYRVIIQDLQFHPVTDEVQHIDFFEVYDEKEIKISLPIHAVGVPVGIQQGGKLRQNKRLLQVKGLVKDLPDYIEIDITPMQVGETITVGDVDLGNLKSTTQDTQLLIALRSSRSIAPVLPAEGEEGEEGEEEGEEGEEGEEAEKEEAAEE